MPVRRYRANPGPADLLAIPGVPEAARGIVHDLSPAGMMEARRLPPEAYMRRGSSRRTRGQRMRTGRERRNPPRACFLCTHEATRVVWEPHGDSFVARWYCRAHAPRHADVAYPAHETWPTRRNPPLILVTGNPPMPHAAAVRRWCEFHQRDDFDGAVRDVPVPGTPPVVVGIGTLAAIDLGDGDQSFRGGAPLLGFEPSGRGRLWIVSPGQSMNLGDANGATVVSVTYRPVRETGHEKKGHLWRHEFESPRPTLRVAASSRGCAAYLGGGGYRVTEWLYN